MLLKPHELFPVVTAQTQTCQGAETQQPGPFSDNACVGCSDPSHISSPPPLLSTLSTSGKTLGKNRQREETC